MRGHDFLDMEAYLGGTFLHPGGIRATQAMFERLRLEPWRIELWSVQGLFNRTPPQVWRPPT